MEWDLPVTDRAKSEAKYGGSKLRRFQSPCAIFTIHVNMKDRIGRLRRRKLGPPSELYKDWNDTCKPNFEAFVEADMQVIPSPP